MPCCEPDQSSQQPSSDLRIDSIENQNVIAQKTVTAAISGMKSQGIELAEGTNQSTHLIGILQVEIGMIQQCPDLR